METPIIEDLKDFFKALFRYSRYRLGFFLEYFETNKSSVAAGLYRQRGKYTRPFMHVGMAFLVVSGVTVGPMLISENLQDPWKDSLPPSAVLSAATTEEMETSTLISAKPRAEALEYTVKEGDTVSSIAEKFGVSVDTIRWENNLTSVKTVKVGQVLKILPTTGVLYRVKQGETVYSIAKKLQVDPQVIVDWPYNSFSNDETFELAVGQTLMVPDGIEPQEAPVAPRKQYAVVPGAGALSGTGQYVWPTSGRITQGYSWYHKAIDIANHDLPDILAADSGTVIISGWPTPWAYGNRIVIDHKNGAITLYGHMSQLYVQAGASVQRGQLIGKMGSTGRSTGPHLHFEVRVGGELKNPLEYLK